MRTLGMLGGMAWPSTADAYRLINQEVTSRLGGAHSADLLLRSFDFAVVEGLQHEGRWDDAGELLAEAARRLEAAGAEALYLCSNTMHRVADAIEAAVDAPLLHIADATADAVQRAGAERVALLGTRFTMEEAFYRDRLVAHGLDVVVPDQSGREAVHHIIYEELIHGQVREASRDRILEVVAPLIADGARGVVAGCTEIELLVRPEDVDVLYFPTTRIHAMSAVDWMLDGA